MEIKTELFYEELKNIFDGKDIDFYRQDNTLVIIKGLDNKDKLFGFISELFNMTEERFDLMQDILERYDNEEYWNHEVIQYE